MKWSQCPEVGIAEVGGGTRLAVTQEEEEEEEKPGRVWTRGVHLAISGFNCHTSQAVAPTLPTSFPHRDKSYSWKLSQHLGLSSWAKCIMSTCWQAPAPRDDGEIEPRAAGALTIGKHCHERLTQGETSPRGSGGNSRVNRRGNTQVPEIKVK